MSSSLNTVNLCIQDLDIYQEAPEPGSKHIKAIKDTLESSIEKKFEKKYQQLAERYEFGELREAKSEAKELLFMAKKESELNQKQ